MKLNIQIKNKITKLRKYPNEGAAVIDVMTIDSIDYITTKMCKGWYYVDAAYGWLYSSDVIVTKTIEPYDPFKDEVDFDSTKIESTETKTIYDPDSVVKAANASSLFINAIRIAYADGNTEVNMQTLIKQLLNSLNDMNGTIATVDKMASIPLTTKSNVEGQVPIIQADGTILWAKLSYNDLANLPEDTIIACQF